MGNPISRQAKKYQLEYLLDKLTKEKAKPSEIAKVNTELQSLNEDY